MFIMEKIKISQAIIVEGKYDKIKLSSFIDGVIIVTNGFGIYKDKDIVQLIRYYAQRQGIIVLTDSDTAGFRIRGHIKSIVPKGKIINLYAPEILGKEKRKTHPSKEGKLGVEGINVNVLKALFEKVGVKGEIRENPSPVTNLDFFQLGITGQKNSSRLREKLLDKLELPKLVSSKALLEIVNSRFSKDEFYEFMENDEIS